MRYRKAIFLSFLSGLTASTTAFATSPIISGASGLSYFGLRDENSTQEYFLGIPFAEPPVGALRFKPPVSWSPTNTTIVNATQMGYSCLQSTDINIKDKTSEDCLTLNIWKPANVTKKLPVMVWITGGGFFSGGAVLCPGGSLVDRSIKIGKPAIYVAMNYRVGLFGFPPGQEAADEGAVNLGLKDQRLSLEWVQKNIGYFGGDPNKVMLFGESAGSISTVLQSFYKGGKIGGVFRGMIQQSGSATSFNVPWSNDPAREATFSLIVNATGCADSPHQFECVRNAPVDVLSQADKDAFLAGSALGGNGKTLLLYGPTRYPNDDFLPDSPSTILHEGKFAKVPFINGGAYNISVLLPTLSSTAVAQLDEATGFFNTASPNNEQDVINMLAGWFPGFSSDNSSTLLRELLQYYPASPDAGSPYGTGNETFGQGAQYKRVASILGDIAFQAPRRDQLRAAIKFGVKARSYVMSEPSPNYVPYLGVAHGGDVPFVLQLIGLLGSPVSPAQLELQHMIGDYWINFAHHLDPNPQGKTISTVPYWPLYGKKEIALQLLGSNVTAFKDSARASAINFIIDNIPNIYKYPQHSLPSTQVTFP
ncbi:alpha/beta-hydrolase [Ceratobasidium sp. AG-I]|nr:alpha/beta-hydrolase [Ceratobasidium sp. AG-I]